MSTLCLPYMKAPAEGPRYRFFGLPKQLLTSPVFAGLHRMAKLLYSMMLNRLTLSESKGQEYMDDQGRLYIIYTIDQVRSDLNCAKGTAVKLLKQLADLGLIEKKRRGQGKPSLLYIKDFQAVEESKKLEAEQEQPEETPSQKGGVLNFLNLKFFTSETAEQTAAHEAKGQGDTIYDGKMESKEVEKIQEKPGLFGRFRAFRKSLSKNGSGRERKEKGRRTCFQKLKIFTSRI